MKPQIYHAPIGDGQNRVWVQLERLTDDDAGSGYIIKATLAVLTIAAVFGIILCMINPPA